MSIKEQRKEELLSETDSHMSRMAERAKEITGSQKRNLAEGLYNKLDYNYGFEESLKNGTLAPFPHEVDEQVTCLPYAGVVFFLAEKLGLEPRLMNCSSLGGHEKDKSQDCLSASHAFVDVDVGHKHRILLDKQCNMFGHVTYDTINRTISVRDNEHTDHTKKSYFFMRDIGKDELVEHLMHCRTPVGSIRVLESGQRTGKSFQVSRQKGPLWMSYDRKRDTLETAVHKERPIFMDFGVRHTYSFDESGSMEEKSVELFGYGNHEWMSYTNEVVMGRFTWEEVAPFYSTLDELLATKDTNTTRNRKKSTDEVVDYLASIGVESFTVDEQKLPPSIDASRVSEEMNRMAALAKREIDRSSEGKYGHIIQRSALKQALYELDRSREVSEGEDHDGFIYDEDTRDEYLESKAEKVSALAKDMHDAYMANIRHECGRRKGVTTTKLNNWKDTYNEAEGKLKSVVVLRKNEPKAYHRLMDRYQYSQRQLSSRDLDDIGEEVTSRRGDPEEASMQNIFYRLVHAYQARTVLDHQEYLPQLVGFVQDYVRSRRVENALKEQGDEERLATFRDQMHAKRPRTYIAKMERTLGF